MVLSLKPLGFGSAFGFPVVSRQPVLDFIA
jgi:hypothetical protein